MASTYTPIATTTSTGSVNSITFSSIPSTYTDLVLVFSGAFAANATLFMQLNSDTGTNYSDTVVYGNGSSALSARDTNYNQMSCCWLSSGKTNQFVTTINLMNYANTTTYKSALIRTSESSAEVATLVGLWRSTSAVNTIKIFSNNGSNMVSGSIATLYGIKAA